MEKRNLLDGSDVITVDSTDRILISHTTFKVDELVETLTKRLSSEGMDRVKKWLSEGVECELLSPHQGWKKGKVKICLEFYSDEPESPLEDIRQSINQGKNEKD